LLYSGRTMKAHRSIRGFTLIEMLVVLAIMMAVAVLSMPELFAAVNRSRLEGTARQTATLLRAARLESIKQSCYGVVMIDPAKRQVIAFADRDRDGAYEPGAVPPERLIGRVDLPSRIHFQDEAGNKDLSSVEGLENPDTPVTLADGQVMYQQDGSVLDTGALRFADERGNAVEVNVEPRTTGKVEMRKYQDGAWIANGEGGKAWKFNK
jgi:prepilin-type N-terminal cleavage/methylation domain-containing protein